MKITEPEKKKAIFTEALLTLAALLAVVMIKRSEIIYKFYLRIKARIFSSSLKDSAGSL